MHSMLPALALIIRLCLMLHLHAASRQQQQREATCTCSCHLPARRKHACAGLPSHRNNMLHNSAMLTGFVLPERADSASQPVVLLEADGSFAPAPVTMPGQKRPAYRVSTPRG